MQSSPSNKVYAQALTKLRSLVSRYSVAKNRDVDLLAVEIADTLREVSKQANGPSLVYKELNYGEPPSSFQMNLFLQSLGYDINVLLDEMNILKAASVHTHNFIKMEILKSELENQKLHNKIKTLQLYSQSEDSSILYAGDSFYDDGLIDWDKTPVGGRVELIRGDQISLGVASQSQVLDTSAEILIEEGSNGFVGNNQEVEPTTASGALIFFKSESDNSTISKKLSFILDQEPSTFFEFEKYLVKQSDRDKAKNFNFKYSLNGATELEYLKGLNDGANTASWADNEDDLRLIFTIDIGKIEKLNLIKLMPYGFVDNKNAPILIKSVSVSKDGGDWSVLTPENVWVANGIDQNSINLDGENIVIDTASFRVDAEEVQYIRFSIEQPVTLPAEIGHMFYHDPDEQTADGEEKTRFEGPIPSAARTWEEKQPQNSYQNSLIQKREVFQGSRWAIGIRDISALSVKYNETSSLISKRFFVPGGVDRLSLEADVELPDNFARNAMWVRFFVSPDDGNSWHQISRIQDDFLNIPEVIAYNDNTPVDLRLPGVKYIETDSTPVNLRVKIEMDRPTGDSTLTPIVRSYNLKIKQRVLT